MITQPTPFPFSLSSQAEQERLRYAIEAAQVGTWHLDIGQHQVWLDARCQELFDLQGNEVIGYDRFLSHVFADDQHRVDEAVKAAFDPSTSGFFDVQFRTPDGQSRWLHCQGRAYVDVLGAAYRLSGVARDITVQVQTQYQLEASKARFRSIVINSPTPTVLFVGRDMVIDTVNVPMLKIWGKDESVVGRSVYQVMPELVNKSLLEQLQRVYDQTDDKPSSDGKATVAVDEQWKQAWFNFSYNPVYSLDGTIFGFIHTATDVTGEIRALQELQRSEIRFQALIEEAPVATCLLVGRELTIKVANESMLIACGKQNDVIGQPLLQAFPELQGQSLVGYLTSIFDTGETYSVQGARADFFVSGLRETHYVDCTAKALFNDQGEANAVLVMVTDVTNQVLAQQVIQRSEEQKRFLLQLTDQLRNATNTDDVYFQAARLLGVYLGASRVGYAQDQGNGRTLIIQPTYANGVDGWQTPHPYADYTPLLSGFEKKRTVVRSDVAHDASLTQAQRDAYRERQLGATLTKPIVLKDDSVSLLFIHYQQAHSWTDQELMLVEEASARLIIAVERALAERALRESEQQYRLLSEDLEYRVAQRTEELVQLNQDLQRSNENLQQFAYVASHDLQEPLRKIQSFSSLLTAQLEGPQHELARNLLQRIATAGARMSTLIKDLLTYSRISTRQQVFDSVSLTKIITGVLNTLDWQIEQTGAQITIDELPFVDGDEMQLSQLFQNLLTNALKFVVPGQKPRVQIRYHLRPQAELPPTVRPSRVVPYYHQISVIDQGVGFDIKYLDRIFQVFQRLHGKNEFAGTGVGLAICQRVVENHGGGLTANSELGAGATFCVYLPA